MKPPFPDHEAARLEALQRYRILDTAPEQSFDDIATLASYLCKTPIALISLVDAERQWFKSSVGLPTTETHRDLAFCAHTIVQKKLLVVPDATKDARFSSNPFVTGDPHIRFYAGAALLTPEGHGLGSLCVIDSTPRTLNPEQTAALEALARQIVIQLELRRTSHDLAMAVENIKTLSGLLPMCAFCKGIRDMRECLC